MTGINIDPDEGIMDQWWTWCGERGLIIGRDLAVGPCRTSERSSLIMHSLGRPSCSRSISCGTTFYIPSHPPCPVILITVLIP